MPNKQSIPLATHKNIFDLKKIVLDMFTVKQLGKSLTKVNRFGGRTHQPLSIDTHSLLVYEIANYEPWGLLHDWHENIMGSLTSPGRQFNPEFK